MIENVTNNGSILGMLILASVIALSICVPMALIANKKYKLVKKQLEHLEKDLRISNGSMVAMGKQIMEFEQQLSNRTNPALAQAASENTTQVTIVNSTEELSKKTTHNHAQEPREVLASTPLHAFSKGSEADDKEASLRPSIYDQAKTSLAKGIGIAEVAKQCGLSFAEVSLLQSLSNTPSSTS